MHKFSLGLRGGKDISTCNQNLVKFSPFSNKFYLFLKPLCGYFERMTSQRFCMCISVQLTSWPKIVRVLSPLSIWSFSFQTLLISADDNGGSYSRALLTFWLWRWIRRASKRKFAKWNMSVADERSENYSLWPPFLPRMYRGAFTKVLQSVPW